VSVSRRRFLESGLAACAGIAGAQAIASLLPSGGVGVAAADGATSSASPAPSASPASSPAPAYDPNAHSWAFLVDTTRCIGCGRCVGACKNENSVPDDPEYNRTWVELHVVQNNGKVLVTSPDGGIDGFPPEPPELAANGTTADQAYFVPRLCMQCDNPPCTSVCPVSATYKTPDGVVLVDQDRCIGCGYCVLACPYGARYIVPSGGNTPMGSAGVVDKCTFCYHRITKGMQPACVEVCPVEARLIGDLDDPASPVTIAIRTGRTSVMKPELGTRPRVHYVGLEGEVG
jgi:Fe-S-cluster-containing dehydrogenase component